MLIPPTLTFTIHETKTMLRFGKTIARILLLQNYTGFILFYGPVGSGKTTFTRGFVENFPKSEYAEVTSPSFTIYNNYPTIPEIIHCDLYRFPKIQPPELDEIFCNTSAITLIEWAEHLPYITKPNEHLAFHFFITEHNIREITCTFHGEKEQQAFKEIMKQKTIQHTL